MKKYVENMKEYVKKYEEICGNMLIKTRLALPAQNLSFINRRFDRLTVFIKIN